MAATISTIASNVGAQRLDDRTHHGDEPFPFGRAEQYTAVTADICQCCEALTSGTPPIMANPMVYVQRDAAVAVRSVPNRTFLLCFRSRTPLLVALPAKVHIHFNLQLSI